MNDEAKSKAQLIAELEALRRHVANLEAREFEPQPESGRVDPPQWAEVEYVQLLAQTQRALAKTELLYHMARSLIALKSLPELLQLVVNRVAETVSADRVRLAIFDPPNRQVTYLVEGGDWPIRGNMFDKDTLFGMLWEGLAGWSFRNRESILSLKDRLDPRESPQAQQRRIKFDVGSVIVVPLQYRDDVQGTLAALRQHDKPDFTPEDLELMEAMANQAALAIENSRLFQLLQDNEARLAQERNLLRTLIDNLPDYIYVKDCESRFQLSNKASFTSLGVSSQEEVLGKTDFDLFPPEVAQLFFEDEQRLLQTGQPIIDKEEPGRDVHWNRRWLLTNKVPLRDQEGEIIGLVGISRDITEAKLAREAEAISRDLLQRLIHQLPIGVEIFDLQGFTIGMNQALMDIFGINEPDNVIGHFNLFTDPLAAKTGTQAAGRVALAGQMVHLPEVFFDFSQADRRFNQATGYRILAVTFFPIRNAQDEVVQLVALNEDITDRKRAEEALRESEERYRRLVELSPDGIIIHVEGQIEFINPAGAKLLGAQEAEEVVGRSILDFVPPQYQALVRERHQHVLEKRKRTISSEQKIYRLDGELADVEVTSLPTSYRGQPAIQTVMRNVTERKKLQLELARFRTMMDQSGEAIFVVDPPTSRFIDVNETACRLLGYPREILCQLTSMDIVLEEDYTLEKWLERAEQIKQAKSPVRLSRMYIHKDGTTFPVEVIVSHRNFEGQDYILAVARDMREQTRLETQLRQAQKLEAVGQLAAGVAHNFNNMLTAIMGYVGLAQESLPSDHPVFGDLEGIQNTAQRAANLTQQLLAFTRSQIIQPQLLNLNELVMNMNSMLRQLISESVQLELSLAPDLDWVKVDPGQFEQVLVNLVVNACDAMPDGGRLAITTANVTLNSYDTGQNLGVLPGDYVCLAVTDTGSGMTPEIKEHIFEPFFTTKEVGKGTGLGLATCFGIVRQNQGQIIVESELGQGSTFKIYLPRVNEKTAPASLVEPLNPPLAGTETILLVEDEAAVREMIARILRHQGYTVLEASRAEEALQLAAAQPETQIHLVMTDMVMPGLYGHELAERLRELDPLIKTLFISGYTDNVIQAGMLEPGINFLPKPFSPLMLAQKVRQILDET